jgi:hypothetical protein
MSGLQIDEGGVISWLLEGDPVIRWQTMRDLVGDREAAWRAEQERITREGWGTQFAAQLRLDGTWPEGRWTGTVWTLLTLIDCGIPPDHQPVQAAARQFLERNLTPERAADVKWLVTRMDLCHLGFWLRIGAYFVGSDPRLAQLAEFILTMQMPDGGWNCRKRNVPQTRHSSFHTTFNVLDGLAAAAEAGLVPLEPFRECEAAAMEFMVIHRMYRSDRTGAVIDERFTHLTFPSHWHYTMLRGLDYMRGHAAIGDPRLEDPVALLVSHRRPNGRWPVKKRIPGTTLFDMEKVGGDSRWNTLRAMRVLKSRQEKTATRR